MHHLAKEIGCTVQELAGRLTYAEFADWNQYYRQLNEEPAPDEMEEADPEFFINSFGN